uniref:Candidate secreted effector n=1 Tax=Meloidogyne incognita TaxID=6306 RepID=A0A914LPQ2_MELIC
MPGYSNYLGNTDRTLITSINGLKMNIEYRTFRKTFKNIEYARSNNKHSLATCSITTRKIKKGIR